MKTIEEKAQRYDSNYEVYTELINRLEDIKGAIKNQNYGIAMDILYKPYPEFQITTSTELKESDDERIRQSLIDMLKNDEKHYLKEIAWLEKQGKNNIGISEATKQKLEDNLNKALEKETPESCNEFLDEQGEQKPTDKVEPKFHEGEWVVNNNNRIGVVTKILKEHYIISFDDREEQVSFAWESKFRKWDISDAKDGDVLVCNEEVLLFKSYSVQGRISLYCWYNGRKNNFHSKEVDDTLLTTRNKIYPATKEQRELLFQKMKEVGYEWDSDKKELRKIDWNPQLGDTFRKKGTESPIYHLCNKREDGIHFGFVEERENGAAGGEISIFSLKNEYELVERLKPIEKVIEEEFNKITELKHSWSEEDEKNYDISLKILCASNKSEKLINNLYDWFKSLKDRVQLQNLIVTDEELAQAKKDAYNDALNKIEYHSGEPTFNDGWSAAIWYLKKRNTIPQLQWKPSKEQIMALRWVLNHMLYDSHKEEINGLLEQLIQL